MEIIDIFLEVLDTEKKVSVNIKPNSKTNRIVSYDKTTKVFKIEIKAVPEKGRANIELIKFLRKTTKKDLRILSGLTKRRKIIGFA